MRIGEDDMTPENIQSNYKQAVITCAWVVTGGYRQLIFGMVDFIPKFLGEEQGIAEQGIKVKDRRMYHVRHVTSVEEGYRWYSGAIETGAVEMPWDDPSKRIALCVKRPNDTQSNAQTKTRQMPKSPVAPRAEIW